MKLEKKENNQRAPADYPHAWEYCIDAQGRVIYVSSSWYGISGLVPEDILKDPLIISTTIHPEDLPAYEEHVKNAYKKKLPGEVEYRILLTDSDMRWINHSCEPFFDEKGQYAGTKGRNWDITERKNIEHVITVQRDLGIALDKASSLQESLHLCLAAALNVSGLEAGGIYSLDQATGDLNLILFSGHTDKFIKINSKLPADSKQTRIVMAGEPFYLNNQNIQDARAADLLEEKIRSLAAIPFINKGQVFGSLHVSSRIHNEISVHSRNALETIARQIGAAISRAQAEQNLKISEAKYRAIFENAVEGIFQTTPEGRILSVNNTMARLFGYDSPSDLLNRVDNVKDIYVHPKDRVAFCREIETMGTVQKCEVSMIRKDGEEILVAIRAKAIKDKEGRTVCYDGFYEDITQRKKMEDDLHKSEERFRSLLKSSRDAILMMDPEGRTSYWNPAAERMFGYTSAEVMGRNLHELIAPERHLKAHRKAYAEFLRTGRMAAAGKTLELQAIRKDRSEITVALSFSAERINGGWNAIGILRDITDRKKAEEKYKGIFDNAVMGIFQSTPEGRITSANLAFARLLGYESPTEVINTITDIARQVYVSPKRRAELFHCIEERGTVHGQEVQYLKKDGSTALALASGRAVRDGAGKVLYCECTVQDITEFRRLESQFRQAQKMEAIGTLAGGLAHDFNNILASMMGYTEMAGGETRQDVRRDYLDQVLRACERAKNLVNQIMAFSRSREQELRPLDIRLILKEALNLLKAALPTTIEIKQDITREETDVLADPTQIHQIVMNLCTNAAHAMREKGGLLDIHLSNIEILRPEFSPHPDLRVGSYVQLSVRDTGHGIDAAIKDKIFDPFFTTKQAKEGTGLGLSVVYGIVKSYGGAIDVQSLAGEGATFTIYLPRIPSEDKVEEEGPETIDLQGHERILFVDDEAMLVKMAKTFFRSLGYSMTGTTSSVEALRLFQEDPGSFDLVITDMTMPHLTGAELARTLLKIRPDLPIILCTGYSDSINMADARKLSLREFILKPISLNDLGMAVRRVLKSENQQG
jgi:two-component system, cell cycle sensor histidine kinase and response regulator CckA